MSTRPYETIESLVPRSWVKRMERLAERNGVERDAIVAQACADFLRNHKQAKEKAAARFYEYQEEQAKQLWSKL